MDRTTSRSYARVRVDQRHQAALRACETISDFWIGYSETIARKMIMADELSDDGMSVRLAVASYDLAAMRADPGGDSDIDHGAASETVR
ncbi:MAG TPA: hypothetical protein VMM79_21315 [Longimicrobiales bacterium]|nr:hypothetical protein [Longimicrobiales bacterium]